MTVTSDFGCTATTTYVVDVLAQPIANFTFDNECYYDNIDFTDASSAGIPNFAWDFGDGTTSTSQNPSHSYTQPGIYNVSLTISTNDGCSDDITQAVVAYPQPVADFETVTECLGDITSFTDLSTVDNIDNDEVAAWAWDFGDGTTASLQNPTHTFATSGTHTVTLTVTTNNGCEHTVTQTIEIWPLPVPDFSAATVCLNFPTNFVDNSSDPAGGNIVDWAWDFGDGTTSTAQNPSHTFATDGTHTVTLTVTTDNGCSETVTLPVEVLSLPVADFTFDNECYYDNINFTDASSTGIPNFAWDFDDGNSSTDQNPSHAYAQEGIYDVTLIISTNDGCADTITQSVIAYPQPVANFETVTECLGDITSFTDLSTVVNIDNDEVVAWAWDFGDGTTASLQNPTHTFATSGTHTVTLTVTTNNGCEHTVSQTIEIWPLPVPDFSAATVCLNFPTNFVDNSSDPAGGNIVDWAWDFGDGTTSTAQNPTHTFATDGTHTVTLTVTTDNGCSETVTLPIEVLSLPVADFTFDNECYYDNINFTDASTAGIPNFVWDFDDGNSSTDQNPSHAYAQEGIYDVTLIISTNDGCTDTITQSVIAYPQPVANFETVTECLGDVTSFTDLSTVVNIDNDEVVAWAWDFGDGTTASLQHPTHTFATSGTHTVTLTVTTNNGCEHTVSQTIEIWPLPVPDFSATSVCLNFPTNFVDNSSDPAGGNIVDWAWDFGDGTTSTAQNPTHTFATDGTHTVTLTVTTDNGCSETVTLPIEVLSLPVANFTFDNACYYDNINFTDASSTGIPNFVWDFGDGNTSSNQNPSHAYAQAGIYEVTLIIFTNDGCSDTTSHEVIAYPQPTANFAFEDICLNNTSEFADLSTIIPVDNDQIVSWNWNFGEGNTSSLANPTHVYANENQYNVSLEVVTNNGCSHIFNQTVSVYPLPDVDF